ncbi:MAG: type II toxin-antitoxin system HicB family antitoxin [Hyphomicrobium aestuarii]|nr:type II toxin-antitoxin system HicB family antitoxin [Hyphomicrobium aestuarii]
MYVVAIVETDGAGYGVRIPDFPGCYAQADTVDGAIANATLAVREWAEDHVGGGVSMPSLRGSHEVSNDVDTEFDPATETLFLIPVLLDSQRTVKANISLNAGLLDQIDAEAARRGLTRSAFLISAAIDKIANAR